MCDAAASAAAAAAAGPSHAVSAATFLDLCDDTVRCTLDLLRPFEAICLGLTCRRLHELVQERRAVIVAKLRATGCREVCYCVNAQTGTPLGPWLWGHIDCAHPTPAVQILCGLAAGGHTKIFLGMAAALVAHRDSLTLANMYMVFNAAVGAGEIEIANIMLAHMEFKMPKCRRTPKISADSGFLAAATNGHYALLHKAYVEDEWDTRVWHSDIGIVSAALCGNAPVEHITVHTNPRSFVPKIVRRVLEHRRLDVLVELFPKNVWMAQVFPLEKLNVVKTGREVLLAALEYGVSLSKEVFRDALESGHVQEALLMREHWPYIWPDHSLANVARQAGPEDLILLIAAGCPWDPMATEVALERGDPVVFQLVASASGAYWTEPLLERLRCEGGAAAELARSAGAPL